MAKQYQIRWTKSDFSKLSWAVRNFNKTVQKLQNIENDLIVPNVYDYSDIKSKILTRYELNRTIKMLNRFSNKNEQRIVETDMGEKITNWELKELKKEKKRAERQLTSKLIEVKEKNEKERLGFKNDEQIEIEQTLKSFEKLFTTKGADFKRVRERIHRHGSMNYEMWRNDIFKNNFLTALESNAKNYKNYEVLKKKLESIKNPNDFYNYIQSNDYLADTFLRYNKGNGLVQGAFVTDEETFDYTLMKLGLLKE